MLPGVNKAIRQMALMQPRQEVPPEQMALRSSTDAELMASLVEKNAEALTVLYDRHAAAVFGMARTILHDRRLAEEVGQDVFLLIWQHPSLFEPSRGAFGGWLLRVTRNRSIDLLRKKREQLFADGPTGDDGQALDPASWLVDPDPDPGDQASAAMTRIEVGRALGNLTDDQRQLLELAYFGGLTQREISERLGRPLGTVKTQMRTAMQKLAALLANEDERRTPRNKAQGISQLNSSEKSTETDVS
jgi:RNA polymerase sigma-70 factor (ECF subfamily)